MKKGVQITLLSGQIIDDYPTAIVARRRLLWSIDQTAMFVLVTRLDISGESRALQLINTRKSQLDHDLEHVYLVTRGLEFGALPVADP